jgi:hypothetical protein
VGGANLAVFIPSRPVLYQRVGSAIGSRWTRRWCGRRQPTNQEHLANAPRALRVSAPDDLDSGHNKREGAGMRMSFDTLLE